MVIKTNSERDFYYKFMKILSLKTAFNERELQVAVEFLCYRDIYLQDPIKKVNVIESEDGTAKEVEEEMSMLHQLIDTRTIAPIMDKLNMPVSVFRKHVSSLKQKGFFSKEDLSKKYLPPKTKNINIKLTLA